MRTLSIVLVAACGAAPDPAVDAPIPTKFGTISLTSVRYQMQGAPKTDGMADATFEVGAGLCTTTATFGACVVSGCTDIQPVTTAYSAGIVTITGAVTPISLHPETGNRYVGFQTNQALFTGGESLEVMASGAGVPAFTASLTAPTIPTMTSPAEPSGQTLITIARSSDLTVAWTGIPTGTVRAHLSGGPFASTEVDCTFDAAAGTGTIPTQALMMVPTGPSSYFQLDSIRELQVDAGEWAVTVRATINAVWPTGTFAGGAVTLE